MDAREAALSMWGVVRFAAVVSPGLRKLKGHVVPLLRYGCMYPNGTRKKKMNVDRMVKKWVPIIRGLATAHSRDELDKCEYEIDECLAPILTAPVAQIRSFWAKLCEALEKDKQIPFYVWAMFKAWDETILAKAPDASVKRLKLKLAEQVADLVEEQVRPDLKDAIAGALKWRPEADLEAISSAVKKGGRPRMVGRESCLFLEVHEPKATPAADKDDDQPLARVML